MIGKEKNQTVFQRYEIKYLLTRKQKESILAAMEPYMELDQYGRSTIRNIYYDTESYRLARRSLEKPVYKEKLRMRSYQQAGPDDQVFVELKKKYDSVVYKRRFSASLLQAQAYLAEDNKESGTVKSPEGREGKSKTAQIMEEIDYFLQFYGSLEPRVFLSYEREAYASRGQEEFRVTFDENILWRETDLSLEKGVYGEAVLGPGQVLMECKTPGGIPLWMVHALSREKAFRTTFSKYGNAYQMMIREKGEEIYA